MMVKTLWSCSTTNLTVSTRRRRFEIFLVVVTFLTWLSSTVRCQTILVPSRLHVGEKNSLLLISDSSEGSSATLKLFNKGHPTPLLSQEVHFTKGQVSEVPLLLDALTNTIRESATVEVTFSGNAKKVVTEDVEVSTAHGFVFLQTDKPIYRVSETVRFRVLRLDRSLSPLNESVVLKIANHQRIKVEEVVLVTGPPMHIAEHKFNFPLIAKPGTWMAEVFYGPKHKLVASTSFDVMEYILPLFKIDFSMPSYILTTDSTIDITMNVSYTFGKPVRGTVHYRYGIMDAGLGTSDEKTQRTSKYLSSSNTFCFDGGVMRHTADVRFLKDYTAPLRFVVEAVVKECATNALERAHDSSVLVVEKPYTVALRKTVRRYKPNVSNFVTLEILDPHRQPVPNLPFKVEIKSSDMKNPVILHPYIVSSAYPDSKFGQADSTPRTDSEGRVIFNFKTSDNTRKYDVRLETKDPRYTDKQNTHAIFTIEPFSKEESTSLWIENKRDLTYRVGDRFKSHITTSGMISGERLHLLVVSKGTVLLRETLEGASNRAIDFELSNRMVPTVRLLIVGEDAKTKTLVADSLRLSVVPGPSCGVQVDMLEGTNKGGKQQPHSSSQKRKLILPGGAVTLSVKGGTSGDVVGFHAIDEAVYVLRGGAARNASATSYARTLELSDTGCGPGNGANSLEVMRTAGFKALSAHSRTGSSGEVDVCKRQVRRKRAALPGSMLEKNLLEYCCLLARKKTVLKNSCKTKAEIVKKYTSEACASRFMQCCKASSEDRRQFQASASANKNTNTKAAAVSTVTNTATEAADADFIDSGGVDASLVRTDFRDTWLFDLKLLDGSGNQNFTFTTPHSITSWALSTLSITSKQGFCLNTAKHEVTTFKPYFIQVSFPPTIIEHEQTEVVVTVFNYHQIAQPLAVRITFDKVDGICSDWLGAKRAIRNVQVKPGSSVRTAFSIVPIYKGTHTIRIEAKSMDFTDTVVKQLTVLAQGIEREQQLTFDLDPLNRAKRDTRIVSDYYVDETTNSSQRTRVQLRPSVKHGDWITAQANVVPKTLHYIVTAVGERFTPQLNSIEELAALIKKPKGCGEQNMYYMAFNLYSLAYLEQIGRLNERTRRKGVAYLRRALQQQLDFRKADGSYAAFARRNASLWLTGFVAKIVCQASPYLEGQLDERIVTTALQWLAGKQSLDGGFIEEYPLLHEKALGGATTSVGLTAYLNIVFHECRPYLDRYSFAATNGQESQGSASNALPLNITRMIDLSERFLLAKYNASTDTPSKKKSGSGNGGLRYRQALVAYALTFSANAEAAKLRRQLTEALAASSTIDAKRNQQHWANVDWPVETAAYALMAFIAPDRSSKKPSDEQQVDILAYLSIVNWLNGQQKRGTFDNTQDTIVALDALSKYYALYSRRDEEVVEVVGLGGTPKKALHHELQTDVRFDRRLKRSLLFHNANADLLQTLQVDSNTREIDLQTTGTGLGKVSLLILYNEFAPNGGTCRFILDVDVFEYKPGEGGPNGGGQESEFDPDSFFSDTPEKKAKMFYELGVKETEEGVVRHGSTSKGRYLHSNNMTSIVDCCQDTRLAVWKRSLPPFQLFSWNKLADNIRAEQLRKSGLLPPAQSAAGTSKRSTHKSSHQQKAKQQQPDSKKRKTSHKFEPLGVLETELDKPIVLVLNICVRHETRTINYSSDMAILEVSILSGFRPVASDLSAIYQDGQNIYIAHYDVSPSKVTFYFRTVPNSFSNCFAFRIYQQHRVEKMQSALVRMYNYYEQEWVCSRLYTNVRETDYIGLKCDQNTNEAEKCKCVTNLRCPGSSVVDTILKSNRDYRDMEYLFCQHTHIVMGTLVAVGRERSIGNTSNPFYEAPVMTINVDKADDTREIISGDIKPLDVEGGNNSTVVLNFNAECATYVKPFTVGQRVIMMHNPGRDSRWLVDGNSVLKLLDEKSYAEMIYFIDNARRKGTLYNCTSSY